MTTVYKILLKDTKAIISAFISLDEAKKDFLFLQNAAFPFEILLVEEEVDIG